MVNTMATNTEVSGELVLIPPGIPNLDKKEEKSLLKKLSSEKPLFNAENLTITNEGQVFVTGSLEVCEVKDKNGQLIINPIGTSSIPQNYFRNGITVHGNSLYLACTDIHKCENSLFPSLFGDIRTIDQQWSGFMLAGISQWGFGYQVESYILCADLKELQFTDEIPLPKN